MSASRLRRVAAVALAAAGLTAVAAPAAGASTMSISTSQSVVAPYDAGALLSNRNVIVVLGGSGSGKSSLVRAGLVPQLNSTSPIPGRS